MFPGINHSSLTLILVIFFAHIFSGKGNKSKNKQMEPHQIKSFYIENEISSKGLILIYTKKNLIQHIKKQITINKWART